MTTISRKLIQGSFFRVLTPISGVVIMFFMLPFVLNRIGDRWYGLWVLAAAFVGYYGLLDLGLSRANERFISRAIGRGCGDEVNNIFNTCLVLFTGAGIATFIASIAIISVTQFFVDNPLEVRIFRVVTLIIGVTMAISFPVRAFTGFLYSHIRYDIVNIIELIKTLARTALIVFFLSRGGGIIALALISFAVETLQCAVFVIYTLIKHPELKIGKKYYRRHLVRELLGYSIYSFIAGIGDKLQFHLDAFVITAFIGLNYVVHYNIGARVTSYYILLITNAIALVMPVFSMMEGRKDQEGIKRHYLFISKLNTSMAVFLGGMLIIYGKAFIARWMGPQYLDSYNVLVILLIGLIFNAIQITSKTILFSLSKHKMYSITVTIEGIANLLLSILLVRRYGILGVAMGTTIPTLVTNLFIIPAYTVKTIGIIWPQYLRVVLSTFILGGLIILGIWFFTKDLIQDNFMRLFILGLGSSAVFIILNVCVILTKNERRYFKIPI